MLCHSFFALLPKIFEFVADHLYLVLAGVVAIVVGCVGKKGKRKCEGPKMSDSRADVFRRRELLKQKDLNKIGMQTGEFSQRQNHQSVTDSEDCRSRNENKSID